VRKEKMAYVARPQKVQQEEKPACPVRGKVQEKKKRLRRAEKEEAVCVATPQEAQQEKWKRSLVEELRRKAKEHCGKEILEKVRLLELGWYTEKVIVLYLACKRCGSQRYHVEDNRRQGVISRRKLEEMKWCGYIGKVA